MEILIELAKLAGVGLISGLFASAVSNRNHQQRKWWEIRVASYQRAIEALSDLIYYYDTAYTTEVGYGELSKESNERLKEIWEPAFHKIRIAADSGAFVFSEGANLALREFINAGEDPDDMHVERLKQKLDAAKGCLGTLVELSKTDLRLKQPFWERDL